MAKVERVFQQGGYEHMVQYCSQTQEVENFFRNQFGDLNKVSVKTIRDRVVKQLLKKHLDSLRTSTFSTTIVKEECFLYHDLCAWENLHGHGVKQTEDREEMNLFISNMEIFLQMIFKIKILKENKKQMEEEEERKRQKREEKEGVEWIRMKDLQSKVFSRIEKETISYMDQTWSGNPEMSKKIKNITREEWERWIKDLQKHAVPWMTYLKYTYQILLRKRQFYLDEIMKMKNLDDPISKIKKLCFTVSFYNEYSSLINFEIYPLWTEMLLDIMSVVQLSDWFHDSFLSSLIQISYLLLSEMFSEFIQKNPVENGIVQWTEPSKKSLEQFDLTIRNEIQFIHQNLKKYLIQMMDIKDGRNVMISLMSQIF